MKKFKFAIFVGLIIFLASACAPKYEAKQKTISGIVDTIYKGNGYIAFAPYHTWIRFSDGREIHLNTLPEETILPGMEITVFYKLSDRDGILLNLDSIKIESASKARVMSTHIMPSDSPKDGMEKFSATARLVEIIKNQIDEVYIADITKSDFGLVANFIKNNGFLWLSTIVGDNYECFCSDKNGNRYILTLIEEKTVKAKAGLSCQAIFISVKNKNDKAETSFSYSLLPNAITAKAENKRDALLGQKNLIRTIKLLN